MLDKSQKLLSMGGVLIAAILLTRTNHFGSGVEFPDASLAVLFLGGLLGLSLRWLVLAMVAGFAVDLYAIGFAGVPDYCMSLGYIGLIPTYAIVWRFGKLAKGEANELSLKKAVPLAFISLSIAFVVSNAFWYAFSDKVSSLTLAQFSQAVANYYVPYVGYGMMYLSIAYIAYVATSMFSGKLQFSK